VTEIPPDPLKDLEKAVTQRLEENSRKYRIVRALGAFLTFFFSLILGLIVSANTPQSSLGPTLINLAAQSLIGVAGFLAAASGAVAFFYYGKLLEFLGPSSSMTKLARLRIKLAIAAKQSSLVESVKDLNSLASKMTGLSRPLTAEEMAELRQVVFKSLAAAGGIIYSESEKIMKEFTAGPRRTAYYAVFTLSALIVSAFFSILAILAGSGQYLGAAFGFIVLGSGFLALTWSDAHVTLTRLLTMTQMYEAFQPS